MYVYIDTHICLLVTAYNVCAELTLWAFWLCWVTAKSLLACKHMCVYISYVYTYIYIYINICIYISQMTVHLLHLQSKKTHTHICLRTYIYICISIDSTFTTSTIKKDSRVDIWEISGFHSTLSDQQNFEDFFFIFFWTVHWATNRHLRNFRVYCVTTSRFRLAKTHRMPYFDRSFTAKEPHDWWLFCKTWPAT